MFMHAHVAYKTAAAGGAFSASPVTVWPPPGGVAGARAAGETPLMEIAHFTCLQVYPSSDDERCFCAADAPCRADAGLLPLADSLDRLVRGVGPA